MTAANQRTLFVDVQSEPSAKVKQRRQAGVTADKAVVKGSFPRGCSM